jgi:plastocyanin
MFRSALVSVTAFLLVWIGVAEPMRAQPAGKPKQIDVISNDYAFLPFPANIAAGPTVFTFENQGKVWHEVNIARLRSGATIEEFTRADAPRRRDLIERSVGILIGGPGNRPDGRVLVNLMKGSTYVAYCNFKDTPEAPAHLTMGMYKTFTPR